MPIPQEFLEMSNIQGPANQKSKILASDDPCHLFYQYLRPHKFG
ncbi:MULTISPECIES: hypothetical protein [Aerosakkonema]